MAIRQRVTISVPPDLRARMEAEGDGVNWSAEACRAFEHALAQRISQRGANDMREVIARLRASKQQNSMVGAIEAFVKGRNWAMTHAEAWELEKVEAFRASIDGEPTISWEDWFTMDHHAAYSASELVFFAIYPGHDGERSRSEAFWDEMLDEANPPPADVRGFLEGALAVWDEVKGQL